MRKGVLALLVTAFVWSWPNVMIRMLRTDFDVFTQSFFRYLAAAIFLFPVGLIFTRRHILHAASNLKMLLIPSLIMVAHQVFFTAGIFMTSATVSSLMGRLNAILIPALSCIFYEDERRVVGDKSFLLGALISIIGVAGVILGRDAKTEISGSNMGFLFIFMGTLGWSVYAVYIKKVVRSIDPLAIIAFVSLLSIILFLPLVLVFGNIHQVAQASKWKQLLLFGSGILGIGVGNIFYYYAIRYVGTSIASIFFLLLPLSVGVIAFLLLGERLTTIQLTSGVVLILGCWVVTKLAKKRTVE